MALPVRDILDRVRADMDHAPKSSDEWNKRAIYFLRKALETLAQDAPFLFNERQVRIRLEPDVAPTDSTDLLETTADPWVLKRALATTSSVITAWEEDRVWTGRTIRVHNPAEATAADVQKFYHDFQIREVWTSGTTQYVSLDKPWGFTASATNLQWIIETKSVVLPHSVLEIKRLEVIDTPYQQIQGIVAESAYDALRSRNGEGKRSASTPINFFRRAEEPLEAPHYTPTVALTEGTAWNGPEPKGNFQYAFSLVWGQQEVWLNHGNPHTQSATAYSAGRIRPWKESALSPGSDTVDNTDAQQAANSAITVTLPNMDFMAAFHDASPLRYRRSGWKIRIYRKRISQGAGTTPILDFDQRYYLLDEVDGHVESYVDNGSVTPDRNSPAPHPGAYQAIDFYPVPDRRYELLLTASWFHDDVLTETQMPNVHRAAVNLLVAHVKASIYEAKGNFAGEGKCMKDYRIGLERVKKRLGSAVPPSQPRNVGFPRHTKTDKYRYQWRNLTPGDTNQTS